MQVQTDNSVQDPNGNISKPLLCDGFISISDELPKTEEQLNGNGSRYFSPKIMVIVGKRKYVATYQPHRNLFYRKNSLFREDYGRLKAEFWRYL